MIQTIITYGGIALGVCVLGCVVYAVFFCAKKKMVVSDRKPRESIISMTVDADTTYTQMS